MSDSTPEATPLQILCIEDNPVNWRLVQRLLAQAGYGMHWAEEGLKGFDMALAIHPDLILLDINLPGLSGFEIATKFRQHADLKHIPIVALTAKTLKSDRETALVAGCDGFIPKPIDPFTFVNQVRAYLGGQRDRIEVSREAPVLRQFNAQVLEHLEIQLKEAQEANRKLVDAQQALEGRNRSLSRLLSLSQDMVGERDTRRLLERILDQVRTELGALNVHAYRLQLGGFWEGLRWQGEAFDEAPRLSEESPFILRLRNLSGDLCSGPGLRANRIWEEGFGPNFWRPSHMACLLILRNHQDPKEPWGFWVFSREGGEGFSDLEQEMITLHGRLALVNIENAELILSLDESSRALASSYERMESAYQDLQHAREDLSRQGRQRLLEDLFVKIAQRLEAPVSSLHRQSYILDTLMVPEADGSPAPFREETPKALAEIREAAGRIDGLMRALLRRVGKGAPATPEWLDLHELIQQEVVLLQAEGTVSTAVAFELSLEATVPMTYGVYGDFSRLLKLAVQHALGGPEPSTSLGIHSWREGDHFHLEIRDQGGAIAPSLLDQAFEPFALMHEESVLGVRLPDPGLAALKQVLEAYHGEAVLENRDEGTTVHLWFPLR